ncbi:MAG: VOC family protein [Solirubrobacteraceae bacterium]
MGEDSLHGGVPEGYATVTPWIISADTARLLAFVADAFGGEELGRLANPDGVIEHAEMRIGGAIVMAFDARPGWPATPAFLRLFVPDADRAYERALAAGATGVTDVTRLFFGDKVGRVRDPLSNLWWIQERAEIVDPVQQAYRAAEPRSAAAMAYVQESLDTEMKIRAWGGGRNSLTRPAWGEGSRRSVPA